MAGIPAGSIVCFLDEQVRPRGLVVAGYYVPKARLADLDRQVIQVKKDFGLPWHAPVKWNLKDRGYDDVLQMLRGRVEEFREGMLSLVQRLDIRVVACHVWTGALKETAEPWEWAFANVLQRLCIIMDRKSRCERNLQSAYRRLDVVFDCLPRRDRQDEYFQVYRKAYVEGYAFGRNRLPSLHTKGACPCLLVTSTRYSLALQLADMVVGATGAFFDWCWEGRNENHARRHFGPLYPAFDSDERGEVLGCGLVVKESSRSRVQERLQEMGLRWR